MSKENKDLCKRKSEELVEEIRNKAIKMSKPHVKTPIMILQELCAKKVKFQFNFVKLTKNCKYVYI